MRASRGLAVAALAAASAGLAACGDDGQDPTPAAALVTFGGGGAAKKAVVPAASIPALTGSSTKVTLDPGFAKALDGLGLTAGTIGTASLSKGTLSFPITGGSVTYYPPGTVKPFVQGEVLHDGSGFSLSGGGKTVRLANFLVDPGASMLLGKVSVDGDVVGEHVPLFFLDGSTLKPLRTNADGSKAVLEGTTVELTATAAKALNGVFGVKALKGGLVVGVAKITVDTAPAA